MSVGPRRVLVVEDEWLIAAETQDVLESAGVEVVGPVASVAEALELLAGQAVDAAILDVHLNHEMSLSVAERLMETGTPFVFVTGFAAADLPQAFRGCAVLGKPLKAATLLLSLGINCPET